MVGSRRSWVFSRPPVLVTVRTCFSSEHNPACDRRFPRNRTPEGPPDLEDLSGKWRARGQTRRNQRPGSLADVPHQPPSRTAKAVCYP